tara:strand:+ start:231 stop:647 length:417 start_codon:yes stop_codon:yes gene_type:complete
MRSNNYKRNRNRNQNRRNGHGSSSKPTNIDSSGPDVRVRGSAIQVNEKYMALANDASMSGDRIKAESFFQYADHYYRVYMLANGGVDPRKTSVEENNTISSNNETETETRKDQKEEIELVEEKDSVSIEEENLVSSVN